MSITKTFKKFKFEERVKHPCHFSASLNRVVKTLGGNISDADLIMNWANIVGDEMANQIKVVKLTKGKEDRTLTVKMISKSSALLMSYSEKKLLEKLNSYYGHNTIKKIKFVN